MNCQFCEDYEWSKKHRPKTGRELYTKYYVCLYERTLRTGLPQPTLTKDGR
jgi:hypothetical protein